MELVKQYAFPCPLKIVGIGLSFYQSGNRAPAFRTDQLIFRAPVFPFYPGKDTVAAAGMVLQIPDIARVFFAVYFDGLKEVFHGSHLHNRHIFSFI